MDCNATTRRRASSVPTVLLPIPPNPKNKTDLATASLEPHPLHSLFTTPIICCTVSTLIHIADKSPADAIYLQIFLEYIRSLITSISLPLDPHIITVGCPDEGTVRHSGLKGPGYMVLEGDELRYTEIYPTRT